jgi:hypothetical protein
MRKVLLLDTLGNTLGTGGHTVNVMFATGTQLHKNTNLKIGTN